MGQAQSHAYKCSDGKSESQPSDKKPTKQQKSDSKYSNDQNVDQVRRLSSVSNRNIQLLSLRPRGENDAYAENLRSRRRSSLINLILGAPSSGPRFSDDLCSLNSNNFGIEFFPDSYRVAPSVASLRLESIEDLESGNVPGGFKPSHKRRRSSVGSISTQKSDLFSANHDQKEVVQQPEGEKRKQLAPSAYAQQARQHFQGKSSIASTLASIDLTSSFEKFDHSYGYGKHGQSHLGQLFKPVLGSQEPFKQDLKTRMASGRVNQTGRVLRRTGSELSLYSTSSSGSQRQNGSISSSSGKKPSDLMMETKFIVIMQVCIPFILAGFGNMSAGLILNKVAEWKSFHSVPIFFVLLPPFISLKGNIEMTLASRLSTLSNLNLLETNYQKRRAFLSNLVLILSQAIGLSIFAAVLSIICESIIGHNKIVAGSSSLLEISVLVVMASALATAVILVVASSIIMSLSVALARFVQVNPDNLSTLVAALYGDVSCVLIYGLISDKMFTLREQGQVFWPLMILSSILLAWPLLLFAAHRCEETSHIAISSIPPMVTSIVISMGSGAVLSMFVDSYHLIALYQPVVNGFGANLIAVQASRVSTWLWCGALRKMSASIVNSDKATKNLGSLVSFVKVDQPIVEDGAAQSNIIGAIVQMVKTILWSFCNPSPNSVAARLLLVMMVPAHTIYFFAILLLSPSTNIIVTWQFYSIYIGLCLVQVFILLLLCEPLMTFLMSRHLDPDIFGISLLMALADLLGTLCLAGAFTVLAKIGDPNAHITSS